MFAQPGIFSRQRRSWRLFVALPILLLGFSTTQLSAQTMSYQEAANSLVADCGADIKRFCGKAQGNIRECIVSSKTSEKCRATAFLVFLSIDQRADAQSSVAAVCARDIKKHCGYTDPGWGRYLRCLTRNDIAPHVSGQCTAAIDYSGWR